MVFVSAEFAILGARRRMERLCRRRHQRRPCSRYIESLEKQNSYLATAQLGITVVTLAWRCMVSHAFHFLEPYLRRSSMSNCQMSLCIRWVI